jgi:integrase
LLDAYAWCCDAFAGSAAYRRQRRVAAAAFVADHPDLDVWMSRPLDARLAELRRRPLTWPLVAFALLTGRCRADIDFLAAKNFGHSMGRLTAVLYAHDVTELRAAAHRLAMNEPLCAAVVSEDLPLAVAFTGKPPSELTADDLDALDAGIAATPMLTVSMRRRRRAQLFRLRRVLYEARVLDRPAIHRRGDGPATRAASLRSITAPEIRHTIGAYLDLRATVLRPATIAKLQTALVCFGEFISEKHPEVRSISQLERHHVEAFFAWSASRACRGSHARGDRQVGPFVTAHAVITLRGFLDDIAAWGWAEAPPRRLVFASDIPRQPTLLPRALRPDVDRALMSAVSELDDLFARVGLTILRGTGLRIGELLDLELDAVVDYGPAGSWLRVPPGKLNDERAVPLDELTLDAFDGWFQQRRHQRALPHPRDGRLADFVFVERGRRLGPARIQRGLRDAVRAAGLVGVDGEPLHVVAHQLRHTYATSLVNAGMSLQALMSLLGHRSPEMTMRYATLASPTLRAAYETAIGKLRCRIPVAPAGRTPVPDKVDWLRAEMLKTRVAHGYCARDLVAEACPYTNVCETCPNFVTARPSSCPRSMRNSSTSTPCATTPKPAAGPPKPPATNASSPASKSIAAASPTHPACNRRLDAASRAG